MYPSQTTPQPPTTNGQEPPFVPPSAPFVEPSLGQQPPKKSKKKLVFIIVGVILLLAVIAAAVTYKFWYQNPDKVVTDAIVNTIRADKATFSSQLNVEGDTPFQMSVNGAGTRTAVTTDVDVSGKVEENDFSVKGSLLYDEKGDIYVKARNLAEIAEKVPQETKTLQDAVSEFVTKIDNNWIRFTPDNKTVPEEASAVQSCMQKANDTIKNDNSYIMDIYNAYEDHRFIKITEELGTKNGSMGYVVTSDFETLKDFGRAVKESRIFKQLHDCDNSIDFNPDDWKQQESTTNDRIELWVDRWTHQMTGLNVTSEEKNDTTQKVTVTSQFDFNKEVTITTPDQSLSVDDVSQAFERLMMAWYMESSMNGAKNQSSMDTSRFQAL